MGLVLFALFACLCFLAPALLWWLGKVNWLTVCFWAFFGITSIANAFFMKFFIDLLYGWSDSDAWVPFVGPALVQIPFGCMIYGLERENRNPIIAILIGILGSFPVTGLWLVSSALFMR